MIKPLKILKLLLDSSITICLTPVYFASGFSRRDPQKIVFGCHLDYPAGNILSFFKHCLEKSGKKKIIWIAANEKTYKKLKEENLPVLRKNSVSGIYTCLTAQYFCYSSYISDVNFTLSRKARGINLWHGTPLKKIEADIRTGIYSARYKYKKIFALIQPWIFIPPYKIFASSNYEESCFKTAFNIENSQLYRSFPPRLVGLSRRKQEYGNRRIIFAPTFRDGNSTNYEKMVDLEMLNNYCRDNNVELIIKAHPSDKSFDNVNFESLSNTSISDKLTNIYSLLPSIDLLITDYSSIFFDCDYLSIPFILHWPDLKFYTKNCREFYFNPEKHLPHSITYNDNELICKISEKLNSKNKKEIDLIQHYKLAENYPLGIFQEIDTTSPEQTQRHINVQ